MAERSPEEAVDAFVERIRRPLGCVFRGVAIASGTSVGATHGVTLYADGQRSGDPPRMRTHGGNGGLLLDLRLLFQVTPASPRGRRELFFVRPTFYRYDILDREGKEIVVYHWEPEGVSPIRLPHLHVPAATPIILTQRAGSALAGRRTFLNRLHLLTDHVQIVDVVEVLIREFRVDPARPDWERILAAERASDGTS